MVVASPQRSSWGSPRTSTPLARKSVTVATMSSHIRENWCCVPPSYIGPSAGCTPSSAGGSPKINHPPPASTLGQPKTSRNNSRTASGSDVYSRTCAPLIAMAHLASSPVVGVATTRVRTLPVAASPRSAPPADPREPGQSQAHAYSGRVVNERGPLGIRQPLGSEKRLLQLNDG